jgi:hypothetical protein
MSFPIVVSDALNRRVPGFPAGKLYAFQLAVADIAKGRGHGTKVFTNQQTRREFYIYERYEYKLYYSIDPSVDGSLVFEEFLSAEQEDLILDTFAEGPD